MSLIDDFFYSDHRLARICQSMIGYCFLWGLMTIPIMVLFNLDWYFTQTTPYERSLLLQWFKGHLWAPLDFAVSVNYEDPRGHLHAMSPNALLNTIAPSIESIVQQLQHGFWLSVQLAIVVSTGITLALIIKHHKQYVTDLLDSNQCIPARYLRQKRKPCGYWLSQHLSRVPKPKPLELANIPIKPQQETEHLLLQGDNNLGKIRCMGSLLSQLQARGDKVIVYNHDATLIEQHFRVGDKLLNPLDARSQAWNLWADGDLTHDYQAIAATLLPDTLASKTDFITPDDIGAARWIFAQCAQQLKREGRTSIYNLLNSLAHLQHTQVIDWLWETDYHSLALNAENHSAPKLRRLLTRYLNPLSYAPQKTAPFSIANWVTNTHHSQTLFITSQGFMHELIQPLLTTWLNIALVSRLNSVNAHSSRLWFIIDDLDSLPALPALEKAIVTPHPQGGCFILSVQDPKHLSGHDKKTPHKTLFDCCKTRLYFQSRCDDAARWAGNMLNINRRSRSKTARWYHAITATQPTNAIPPLCSIAENKAYLALGDETCVTRIKFKAQLTFSKTERFIRHDLNPFHPSPFKYQDITDSPRPIAQAKTYPYESAKTNPVSTHVNPSADTLQQPQEQQQQQTSQHKSLSAQSDHDDDLDNTKELKPPTLHQKTPQSKSHKALDFDCFMGM